jgi:hypothetical protein
MINTIFDSYGTPILIGLFIILFIVETKFQLRKRVQNRWKRMVTNFYCFYSCICIAAATVYSCNDLAGSKKSALAVWIKLFV